MHVSIIPLFRAGDLKDPVKLAARLRDATDPLTRFLQKQFSPGARRILDKHTGTNPSVTVLEENLILELNHILQGPCLYEEERFSQVTLTEGTHILIDLNLQGDDLVCLNRILVEEAYPQEIGISYASFDLIQKKGLEEIKKGRRQRPFCKAVCIRAVDEVKERKRDRPFSRLFYEMAFFYREEQCLATTYNMWKPVMRRWIVNWDYQLIWENLDYVVDDLIYATFDALFRAVLQNRFTDFEAGKVHNFFKRTAYLKVCGRYRQKKRWVISRMNKRKKELSEDHRDILRDEILPEFKDVRSFIELQLFARYVLQREAIKTIVKDEMILRELGGVHNPSSALHNRKDTMFWNVFKLARKKDLKAETREYRNLLTAWIGEDLFEEPRFISFDELNEERFTVEESEEEPEDLYNSE